MLGADIKRERIRIMTDLRKRMIQDMSLAGLAAGTQDNYARSVAQLARYYNLRPDRLTEEQARRARNVSVQVQRHPLLLRPNPRTGLGVVL